MGRKMHFFHSSRHFRKLKHCMVNNSDKSKLFCWNYFHVGGVPNFTMSAYEPNHHSVSTKNYHCVDQANDMCCARTRPVWTMRRTPITDNGSQKSDWNRNKNNLCQLIYINHKAM